MSSSVGDYSCHFSEYTFMYFPSAYIFIAKTIGLQFMFYSVFETVKKINNKYTSSLMY